MQNNGKEEIPVRWKEDVFWFADMNFVEDGTYDLVFEIWDLAGNKTVIKPKYFVLDTVPYKVSMKVNDLEVDTNHTYRTNQKVNLSFSWEEAYPDIEELWLVHDKQRLKLPLRNDGFEWEAMPSKEKESSYSFYLTLKDKAGNITHKEFQIVLDSLLADPQIGNDVFHGTPYPYEWGKEIIEDGYYELQVYVQVNAQNQKGFLQPFRFEIDTTAPKLAMMDENGNMIEQNAKIKKKNLQLSILMEEDKNDEKLTSLYINGIKQKVNNNLNFIFLPETGFVKVEAQAEDAAGNISTYTWQGYVLENYMKKKILSIFRSNEMGIIAGVIILFIVSCGFWIWKKHEK